MNNLVGVSVVCEVFIVQCCADNNRVLYCSDSRLFILSRPWKATVTQTSSHRKPASTVKGSRAEGHEKTDTCSYGVQKICGLPGSFIDYKIIWFLILLHVFV
jgi:hypothetical protein